MVTVTQLAPSQTPMIAMTHEDISGIDDIVVEPCMRIAHQGQVDLHERHDLETIDLTHAYEESGSPLLETPLFDQVVETDSLMGHLLPGLVDSDEDALFIGRDGHSVSFLAREVLHMFCLVCRCYLNIYTTRHLTL
jgi:hypothetical protein